jgi:hypothetical protein
MPIATMTDQERTAVQAYMRLLRTVRATFDEQEPGEQHPVLVAPSVLGEAEQALTAAGLAGNEQRLFTLLAAWCPARETG